MKSETLKKVWTIILTIYVTLTTVASVLFGCLYFLGKGVDGGNKLSAYELVSEVCYDMGILPRKTTTAEEVVANSVENFNKDKIEYEDMPQSLSNILALSLIYAKSMTICDDSGKNIYKPGEFYQVTAQISEAVSISRLYFYYTFDDSIFKTSFIVGTYNAEKAEFQGENQVDIKIEQPKSEKWHFEMCIYESDNVDLMQFEDKPVEKWREYIYLNVKSKESGIYFEEFYDVIPETALKDTAFVSDPSKVDIDATIIDANKKTKTTYTKNTLREGSANDFENDETKLIDISNSVIKAARNVGRTKIDKSEQFKIGDEVLFVKVDADIRAFLLSHGIQPNF